MQFRPHHKKRGWNYKKIIVFGLISIVLIALVLSGIYFYFVYSEEKRCKDFAIQTIESTFKINSSEYRILTNICNLNNPVDVKQRLDSELLSKDGNTVHLIDRIDNCSSSDCDHTLCIGTAKLNEFYVKLTDYVCGNRVFPNGAAINIEIEYQRRECHMYFERTVENRTIFSAFFPRGVGVIKLEKGTLDC